MQSEGKYNIILLMTDQHRADHVGFLPGSKLATPNIDRLAGSVGFSNCLTANPICTPARTALLTGKYTHQIGMLSMSGDLSLQHPTYLQALQRAGYWTAGVGKFHWLQGWPWGTPRGQGYNAATMRPQLEKFGLDYIWEAAGKQLAGANTCDYCLHLQRKGLLADFRDHVPSRGRNSTDPARTSFSGEPWPFDEEDYVDNVIGEQIVKAVEARPADRPFFLFGSFCGPHKPYDPPASFLHAAPEDETDDFIVGDQAMAPELKQRLFRLRRAYKAMIATIDAQVSVILDKLEREDLLESTVIMFTSDHGEMLGDHGRMSKMQPWRQSVAVPTGIRHPAHLAGATCAAPVELTDLTATILDVAGLDPTAALSKSWPAFHDRVPCRSLMPIVKGEAAAVRQHAFSECSGQWQLVQSSGWKYIRYLAGQPAEAAREELYDLARDPDELDNRADDPACREVLAALRLERDRILETTPPAQLAWAPYGTQEGLSAQPQRKDA